MIENLTSLLSFDPVLIGVFAGLSMMTVQMLKNMSVWIDNHAGMVNFVLSIFFASMVVFEVTWVLQIAVITFLIMSAASGVYSASKTKTTIEIPDYSDDK